MTENLITAAYSDATTQVLQLAFERLESEGNIRVDVLRKLAALGQLTDAAKIAAALDGSVLGEAHADR